MEFVPILVLLSTVKKIVDFVRYAASGNTNGIITQVLAWVGGIAVTTLAANTVWADGIIFGDVALSAMGLTSQILAGIALGSAASLAHDFAVHTQTPPLAEDKPRAGSHRSVS